MALTGSEIFWLTFPVQSAIDKVSLYNLSALPLGNWEMKIGRGAGKRAENGGKTNSFCHYYCCTCHKGKLAVVIYESVSGNAVRLDGFSYFHYIKKEQINRTKFLLFLGFANGISPELCIQIWAE